MRQRTLLQTDRQVIDLCNSLANYPRLGLDTESSGPLLVGLTGKRSMVNMQRATLTGLSIGFDDLTSFYAPIGHRKHNISVAAAAKLGQALGEYRGLCLIHNLKHELLATTQGPCPMPLPKRLACTQVASWLADIYAPVRNNQEWSKSYSIKELAPVHCGVKMKTFDETTSGLDFSQLDPKDGLDYACEDAELPLPLWDLCEPRLNEWGLTDLFWSLEMPFVHVLRHMEDSGMGIDDDRVHQTMLQFKEEQAELRETWDWMFPGVGINSSEKLQWFFQNGLWPTKGLPKGKKGNYSTQAEYIKRILSELPEDSQGWVAGNLLLKWKGYTKLINQWGDKLISQAHQFPDLRLHPGALQTGTATGRLAVMDPPLQQIPKRTPEGKRIREAFVAAPGRKLVSADYSQVELRVMAHIIGHGNLFDGFSQDLDLHQLLADDLTKLRGSPIARAAAKNINFQIINGGGGKKLARMAELPESEGQTFMAQFQEARPETFAALRQLHDDCAEAGYARTILKRRRTFLGPTGAPITLQEARDQYNDLRASGHTWKGSESLREAWMLVGSLERQAQNTPMQGSAADMMKMAMVDFFQKMDKKRCRIVMQIHDDLLTEQDDDYAEEGAKLLQECMESVRGRVGLRVPLVAVPTTGQRMSEL